MRKRKRHGEQETRSSLTQAKKSLTASTNAERAQKEMHIQIIVGTYEHVLHGIMMIIPSSLLRSPLNGQDHPARFSHSFLFQAHASSIRSLALSLPAELKDDPSQKVVLATGGSDERINLFHLSTSPPPPSAVPKEPALDKVAVMQNPQNRALGSLLHHSGAVTALTFPSRGKLLSGATDNIIATTRTRDWTVLSMLKAPLPKRIGRPSGDTAGPGDVPAGINSLAVHPSAKLMVSVSKSERCMRLWNLMTGKKAGTLSFACETLSELKEGKWAFGEGQKVEWHPKGDEFAVAFQTAVVVFGMDCRPLVKILPSPVSKIHQIHYIPKSLASDSDDNLSILAVSTEDSRVLFFNTKSWDQNTDGISRAKLVAELSDESVYTGSRIKDFCILLTCFNTMLLTTGSSDGRITAWYVDLRDFRHEDSRKDDGDSNNGISGDEEAILDQRNADSTPRTNGRHLQSRRIGTLIGKFEIGNRITCLTAFMMISNDNNNPSVTNMSSAG